jgi:hypothetical protein
VSNHARKYLTAPAPEWKSPAEVFDEAVRLAGEAFLATVGHDRYEAARQYRESMDIARGVYYGTEPVPKGAAREVPYGTGPAPKVRGLTQAQVRRVYGIAA